MTIEEYREFKEDYLLNDLDEIESHDEEDYESAYGKLIEAFEECYYNDLTDNEQHQIEIASNRLGLIDEIDYFLMEQDKKRMQKIKKILEEREREYARNKAKHLSEITKNH